MSKKIRRMLSTAEAGELAGVSPDTIILWWRQGQFIQPYRFARRTLRWPADEVDAWIEAQRAKNPAN